MLVIMPVAVLLLGAMLQGALARVLSSRAKGWMAFVCSAVAAVFVLAMWPGIIRGDVPSLVLSAWDGPISLAFRMDGLSLVFALMGSIIGSAVLLYAVDYMSHEPAATRFYIIMQVFIAGLLVFVSAEDMFVMYGGWEIIGLCSFMLVGFWYTQPDAAAGARKVLVMTHIAGYGLLAAILVLFARTGSTLWTDPAVTQAFSTGLFFLMLVAALAKSVQFPLHTWIASAMSAPTPVSALLHAACYVKAGVYLVARMHSFAPWPPAWQNTVVWIGAATALIGVLFAMVQTDAKRLLAFSTVSQIGYMMLGLGIGTPLGIAAALLHTINHGLFKGGLFLGAGAVQHATGTRDMGRLGGLARRMPRTAALWLVSAGGITGVPLLNGFVSKWMLYVAALSAGFTVPGLLAWFVSVLTMFTFMSATTGLFFGEDGESSAKAHESPRTMILGSGILAAGCLVLGVAPQLGLDLIIAPALSALGLTSDLGVTWLGLSTAAGSWYTSTGIVLALVSVLAGLVAYRFIGRSRPASAVATSAVCAPALAAGGSAVSGLQPLAFAPVADVAGSPFTGGVPLPRGARVAASDFSKAVQVGIAPFFRIFDVDRYYLAIWHGMLALAARVRRAAEVLERHSMAALVSIAAVIAAAGALATGVVRTEHAGATLVEPWPILVTASIALIGLVLAASARDALRARLVWLLAAGVAAVAAIGVSGEVARLVLLEGSAVLAFIALWATGSGAPGRTAYLAAVVLSAVLLISGTVLAETAPAQIVLALFLAGFAVKLALVPAYMWLPKVAEQTAAPVVGLVIGVVDVAAFAELIGVRQAMPWLFEPAWPWLTLAVLSAVVGAILALAQSDLKRFLAFSTITDAGYVLMGIIAGDVVGLTGAVIGVAVHALAKGLLFTCVSTAEGDTPVSLASRGLARNHPLAAAGFVAGSLAALGVPPTAGYAGHWRLYASALGMSPWLLAALVFATALSVLAYARWIALTWWGGDQDVESEGGSDARRSIWATEKPLVVVSILVSVVSILAAGLWPQVF